MSAYVEDHVFFRTIEGKTMYTTVWEIKPHIKSGGKNNFTSF